MIAAAEVILAAVALVSMAVYLKNSRPAEWAAALATALLIGWML